MNEKHEIKCDGVIILPCLKLSQTAANILTAETPQTFFLIKLMFRL